MQQLPHVIGTHNNDSALEIFRKSPLRQQKYHHHHKCIVLKKIEGCLPALLYS